MKTLRFTCMALLVALALNFCSSAWLTFFSCFTENAPRSLPDLLWGFVLVLALFWPECLGFGLVLRGIQRYLVPPSSWHSVPIAAALGSLSVFISEGRHLHEWRLGTLFNLLTATGAIAGLTIALIALLVSRTHHPHLA
jgi:hypothetical protein